MSMTWSTTSSAVHCAHGEGLAHASDFTRATFASNASARTRYLAEIDVMASLLDGAADLAQVFAERQPALQVLAEPQLAAQGLTLPHAVRLRSFDIPDAARLLDERTGLGRRHEQH